MRECDKCQGENGGGGQQGDKNLHERMMELVRGRSGSRSGGQGDGARSRRRSEEGSAPEIVQPLKITVGDGDKLMQLGFHCTMCLYLMYICIYMRSL